MFWYFRRRRARASKHATEEARPAAQDQQAQRGHQNYSEAPPPPYIPPTTRPFPPTQDEPEFDFKNFSNVKSKYLSDCDDNDQKLKAPMYHHGKSGSNSSSSSSRPEEYDLGPVSDKKESMPSTSNESFHSANKPNEINDRKL